MNLNTNIILSDEEKKEIDKELNSIFTDVKNVSDNLKNVKDLGNIAKEKAQKITKPGWFNKTQSINDLQEAVICNANTTISALDVIDEISENQKKLSNACRAFLVFGALDIARNRAAIDFIEKTMTGGADKTLTQETKEQLINVIKDLKQKQDFFIKQEKHKEKLIQHEARLNKAEAQGNSIVLEINRLKENQDNNKIEIEHNLKIIEEQKTTIEELQKSNKKLQLYIAISMLIGLAAIILGIMNILIK